VTDKLLKEIEEVSHELAIRSEERSSAHASTGASPGGSILHKQIEHMLPRAEELQALVQTQEAIALKDAEAITAGSLGPMVSQYISLTEQYKRVQADMKVADSQDTQLLLSMNNIRRIIKNTEDFARTLPSTIQTEAYSAGNKLKSGDDQHNTPFHWQHDPKDLVGLRIRVQNYVNGEAVTRPSNLRPQDKWTVRYKIEVLSPKEAKAAYRPMLQRKMIWKDDDVSAKLYDTDFFKTLQELSLQGQRWEQDLQQRGKENLERHQALSASMESALVSSVDYIDSVDHLAGSPVVKTRTPSINLGSVG
jgi:hypothetical protein